MTGVRLWRFLAGGGVTYRPYKPHLVESTPGVWYPDDQLCTFVFGSGDTCVKPAGHPGPHSKGPHGSPD